MLGCGREIAPRSRISRIERVWQAEWSGLRFACACGGISVAGKITKLSSQIKAISDSKIHCSHSAAQSVFSETFIPKEPTSKKNSFSSFIFSLTIVSFSETRTAFQVIVRVRGRVQVMITAVMPFSGQANGSRTGLEPRHLPLVGARRVRAAVAPATALLVGGWSLAATVTAADRRLKSSGGMPA